MIVRMELGSRRSAPVMSPKLLTAIVTRTTTILSVIMMGATVVLLNVSRMPILVLMIKGSTIVRTPTPAKMTGPYRVMRHSVTALRSAMVPAKSIVGRRSADGIQINRACLIVAVRS